MSYITPVLKKSNSADANNYRPIALTATTCKIMESIVKDQLVPFLVDKGLLSKQQHAFTKNHSTATNLLECLQDWSVEQNSHSQTDIVFIDFAKAFDSIVLSNQLYKLEFFGTTGQLLEWIRCFLTGRSQCVIIDYII